mgnify:CR=1 FL=1
MVDACAHRFVLFVVDADLLGAALVLDTLVRGLLLCGNPEDNQLPEVGVEVGPAEQRADEPVTADGWRVVVTPTITGSVMGAKSLSSVDATVSRLIVLELAVGALVLVAVTLLSTVAVRRSLRPLRQVELTAVGITAGACAGRPALPDVGPRWYAWTP